MWLINLNSMTGPALVSGALDISSCLTSTDYSMFLGVCYLTSSERQKQTVVVSLKQY